ncbi:MAG TPA: DUF2974 domain-containing protein [Candidatus Limiplasma sp.]|nr:DUF2974 domain-containing protein [Candidatus Limiplasma sp.]HPS80968.1 DUF2974 domain-containing protein [Candidatus Limiplasma sp.]
MPNLQNYVRDQGNIALSEQPFNAADSLALSQLVYMPMEGLLNPGESATVAELWSFLQEHYPNGLADVFQNKRYNLTEACAESLRFFNLTVSDYVNHIDSAQETQFCACTFTLPSGARYIAFRGTDLTVAGWKEDLNMSYRPVPAQADAVAYVTRAAALSEGGLYLGGHSKGGHLALYAAARAPLAVQDRIIRVYSFDGPGVDEATLQSDGYARVSLRVESFIPQSSVVGMLLCYHPLYRVVRSTGLGLLQHDALTWQMENGVFNTLDGLDLGTRVTDEALRQWIDRLSMEDRRLLTETVFRLISAVDPEMIDTLVQDIPGNSVKMVSAFRKLEPEVRVEMRRMLSDLFTSSANETVRKLLPAVFRRASDNPSPIAGMVEKARARQATLRERLRPEKN